jgi:hypothetical protein
MRVNVKSHPGRRNIIITYIAWLATPMALRGACLADRFTIPTLRNEAAHAMTCS